MPFKYLARLTTRAGALLIATAALGLCAGCSGRSLQADNPVLAATPPRKNVAVAAQTDDAAGHVALEDAEGDVTQTSFQDPDGVLPPLNQDISGVAATVNGRPILVADVLERFTPQLAAAEAQLSPSQFAKLKRQLIQKELPAHIEQMVLVDSALSQVPAENQEMIFEQLDQHFSEALQQMQASVGAESLPELEAILQSQGTSITNFQRAFNHQQLAGQAMGMLTPEEPTINRREILQEYKSRREEFTEPEMVRWQQIYISYSKYGGKEQAFEALDEVVEALKAGRPFDEVARAYSDGIKAEDGGVWDWTRRGELTNEEVERMLFELPVGEIGKVVPGKTAFQIVRVMERRPQTTRSFAEMQNQLGQEIKQRKQQKMLEKVLEKLKADAVVTTMFDGEETEQK